LAADITTPAHLKLGPGTHLACLVTQIVGYTLSAHI